MKRLSETGKESLFEDANNDEKKQLLQKPKENGEENGEDDFFEHLGNGETAKRRSFVPEGNFKIFTNNENEDSKS